MLIRLSLSLPPLSQQCNYGGRVTDGTDRETLLSILGQYFCPEVFEPGYALSPSKQWVMPGPDVREYKQYLEFFDTLPAVANPEVFGLHENASLSRDQMETTKVFDSMLLALAASGGTSGGGGKGKAKVRGKEEIVTDLVADLLSKLREEFDMEAVGAKYPTDPKESMNTVLFQELARYNRLLAIIKSTLINVQKGMKGLVVMNSTLESVATDLWVGKVPDAWKGRSFASRKPLGAYYVEFNDRIRMLDHWIDHGAPPIFWISGFFFPQSFLTGVTQNYARKFVIPCVTKGRAARRRARRCARLAPLTPLFPLHPLPPPPRSVDDVVFDPEMCAESVNKDTVKEKPADGCYVYGMFLDGCRWSFAKATLDESEPKVLFTSAPTMLLRPCRKAEVRVFPSYSCPWYRTADRRGVLATTGHSSNYIGRIPMPIDKAPDHCACARARGFRLLPCLPLFHLFFFFLTLRATHPLRSNFCRGTPGRKFAYVA